MSPRYNRRTFLLLGAVSALSACAPRTSSHRTAPQRLAYTPTPTAARSRAYRYTVQKGDTLSALSRRSGLKVAHIIKHNSLRSHVIYPGNILQLPGVSRLRKDPLAHQHYPDDTPAVRAHSARSPTNNGYRLVRRRSWTKQSIRKNNRPMNTVNRITIHHTGEHGDIVKLPDLEVVKRIENYHRNERKWAAIGYHYLIGRDGTVYEGRPSTYQGAHTRSNNRNNLGISVIGDFNKRHPNKKQIRALTALLTDKCRTYNVGKQSLFGHRDLSPSLCPGKHLYAWLQTYKKS